MKHISPIFLVTLLCAVVVFAQRNPNASSPPPPAKVAVVESTNPLDLFSRKGLPEAYVIGGDRSDDLAKWLATEISKYDVESLSVLMAALQKTGFYITDKNQKILYKPTATYDMEMSFYDFEVAGMLKASATGKTTDIRKLAEILSQNNSQIPADKLAKNILADLRNAANSKDERIRFAAKLIFELGKRMVKPVDLTTSTPENYKINAIQLSLIERILLGDLMDSYSKLVAGNLFDRRENWFKTDEVRFLNAGFHTGQTGGCDNWNDLSTLQNTSKNTFKNYNHEKIALFEETLDECERNSDPKKKEECKKRRQEYLELLGSGIKFAVVSLAADKLQAAYNNVKIEIKVQDPIPLVRTKSSSGMGETRDITARFTIDPIDKDTTNQIACLKTMSSGSKQKFDLFDDSALDGTTVSWVVDSEDDSVALSSQSDQLTGQTGQSLISLFGKPQREDLTNRKTYATPTTATLLVFISNHRAILGSKTVDVPVRDWIPCSDDWGGTVNYNRAYQKTIVVKSTRQSNGNGTGDGIRKILILEEAYIKLNPRKPEEMPAKSPNPATINIRYINEDIFEGVSENDPCCGKTEGNFTTKFKRGVRIDASPRSIWVKKPFSVSFNGSQRDFSLGFNGSTVEFPTFIRKIFEASETNCPEDEDQLAPIPTNGEAYLNLNLEDGRYGQRFVGTAGELLFGEKAFILPDGSKVLWEWNLHRCRD